MKIDKAVFATIQIIFTFIVARGLPAVINFFATTFYAHRLLPDAYGKYSLTILSASFISAGLFSWLNMALLRFYEENKQERDNFLYSLKQIFLLLSLAIGIIAILTSLIFGHLVFLVILLSFAQSLFQLFLQLLVSEARPKRYAMMASLNAAVGFLFAYIFITYFKMQALAVIIGIIISNLFTALILYLENWQFKIKYKFDFKLCLKFFKYGYPLSLSLIIGIILYGLDRVMLDMFWGKESVGLYALPYDIANQSITLIFMAFQLYLYPQVLKLFHEHGTEVARQQLERNGQLFLSLILPAMLVLIFFSNKIGQFIARAQYHQAFTVVMPIIAIGAVLQGFKAYYYDLAFQLSHKTLVQLYINGFLILLNFILNLIFIPKYGYLGAAYISLVISLIGLILSYSYGKKHFHVPSLLLWKNIKYIFNAIVLGVAFFGIRKIENIFVMISLGLVAVLIYLVIILLSWKKKE